MKSKSLLRQAFFPFAVAILATTMMQSVQAEAPGALFTAFRQLFGGTPPTVAATANQVFTSNGAGATLWTTPSGGGSGVTGTAIYGDGSDGAANFDGTTVVAGMTPSVNVYTCTRNYYFTSATVNATVSVVTANFSIRGTAGLSIAAANTSTGGSVNNNGGAGGAGSGTTGGTGGTSSGVGSIGGGNGTPCVGGAGGSGVNGAGIAGTSFNTALRRAGGLGGIGGASVGAAGAAGTGTALAPTSGTSRSLGALNGWTDGGGGPNFLGTPFAAGGSGGGGGSGAAAGGGGGGGGGVLSLAFKTITNNGVISANGGSGGNGAGTTGAGGGGGGGGVVVLAYNTFTGNAATASGGAAGTGTVGSPAAGGAGLVVTLANNQ